MIGIRADANDIVATGHIMRCMTIAKQIRALGEEILFFVADEYGINMLTENGLPYVVLGTDWQNPLGETGVLAGEIGKKNIHTMLFDSYCITKEYFETLRKAVDRNLRIAYIDDLYEDIYPVDMVINYNAYYTNFAYEKDYPKTTSLCLGPSYVPLREEFGKSNKKDGADNFVLLSCGGGDILQSMHGILEQAIGDKRFENVSWHVVVGWYHQRKELLEQLAAEHKNIVLHHNVSNMAELMEECQIAVSAAGTMLYELCAMERPTVFFITADNQRYDSDFFACDERMAFAGDIRVQRDVCIQRVLETVQDLLSQKVLRMQMKEKLRPVTDGKGAKRIAEALIQLEEIK